MSEKLFEPVFDENPFLEEEKEKEEVRLDRNRVDFKTEYGDPETGWVYKYKFSNKKKLVLGEKVRKYFANMSRYGDKTFWYWRPKIDDLAYCEAKRWKAIEYRQRQITPLLVIFDKIKQHNKKFRAMRTIARWPGYEWAIFDKPSDSGGIGYSWWHDESKEKLEKIPIRQDLGDEWFAYEERSREVRERVGRFQNLFHEAIQKKYHQYFYGKYVDFGPKIHAIINGRSYIIGGNAQNYGFGVVAGPEDLTVEVINQGKRNDYD